MCRNRHANKERSGFIMGNEGAYLPSSNTKKSSRHYWNIAEETLKFFASKKIMDPEEQKKILEATQHRLTPKMELQTITSKDLLERYMEKANKPVEFEGLRTGLNTLDDYLLGVQKQNFMVICARTGVGKTLVANYIIANFAMQGEKILYLALEESEDEVGDRWAKVVLNNQIDVPDDAVEFSYAEMVSTIKEDKYNLIPLIPLYAQMGFTMICVDMLNNLIDTVRDEDGNVFLNRLVSAAQASNMTLIMTARLRQPQSDKERDFPSMESVYGRVDLGYIVSKCVAVTQLPDEGDGKTNLRLHIIKNRRKRIGMPLKYPKIKVTDKLQITDVGDDIAVSEQLAGYEKNDFGARNRTNTSSPVKTMSSEEKAQVSF